jgi:hypothetical protein
MARSSPALAWPWALTASACRTAACGSRSSGLDGIAQAFQGQPMELIRSDLSVQQQDQVRPG